LTFTREIFEKNSKRKQQNELAASIGAVWAAAGTVTVSTNSFILTIFFQKEW